MMCPAERDDEVRRAYPEPSRRRLYRDGRRAWLAGVCAGIADYFGISVGLVRFLTFLSAILFTMPTVFGYFIAALLLKRRPEHLYASREEEAFWRSVRLEPSRTAHDLLRKFQELERRLRAAEARVTSSEFKLRRQFKDLEG
jgi:phage shock protein C